ncbi:MAG: hypothetical protein V4638_11760 [Bacteroidota bacterium]
MKLLSTLFSFVLITLLLSACKPETIQPPITTEPVFTATVSLDGESFDIKAGVDDAMMNTFISELNGVKKFSGKLGSTSSYIEFGVMAGNLDLLNPYTPTNFSGALNFIQNNSNPVLSIDLEDFANSELISYINWSVNGEFASVDALSIAQPGIYDVCAEVHFNQGLVKTICNQMIVGYELNANAEIHHIVGLDNVVKAWVSSDNSEVAAVEWSIDGEVVSNEKVLNEQIYAGQHEIKGEVLFKNGVIRTKRILVDADNLGLFIGDFSAFENTATVNWDFGADITIKHNGKTYQSITANNSTSSLTVSDISFYGQNAQGKNVYKCSAIMNAYVKEVASGSVVPIQIETVVGIPLD